jgi:hypothetical protein
LAGLGAVAAFGALLIAALEWRQSQAERRDREADQARLIVATFEGLIMKDIPRKRVTIRNHSDKPVFTVRIYGIPTKDGDGRANGGADAEYKQAVLSPGDATDPHAVGGDYSSTPIAEVVNFSFTDAHGRRWRRKGGGQPKRVLETGPLS